MEFNVYYITQGILLFLFKVYYSPFLSCSDYKFCFFDDIIEWPGSVHDASVFSNSYLNKKLRDASIPKCSKTIVPGEPAVPICYLAILRLLCYHILWKSFLIVGKIMKSNFFWLSTIFWHINWCIVAICCITCWRWKGLF